MFKVGIIGYGKMGHIREQTILSTGKGKVVAVFDIAPVNTEIPVTKTADDIIKSPEIDVVFVCTPNKFTPEFVVSALNNGKHVFCEKPPGRNVSDIKRIIKAERINKGKKLKFGFNHRYHDAVMEAESIIKSNRYGKILWMRGVYGKSGGVDFKNQWRNDPELAGGGILLDQGIHMIDLFRLFCGEFEEVNSFITTSYWDIELEDNAFVLLRNKRKQVAMFHSSSTQWKHRFTLEIFLEAGYVIINGILSSTRSYGHGERLITAMKQFEDKSYAIGSPSESVTYFDKDRSWKREIEEFFNCIEKDKEIIVGSSYDALKAMELIDIIYRADKKWYNRKGNHRTGKRGVS